MKLVLMNGDGFTVAAIAHEGEPPLQVLWLDQDRLRKDNPGILLTEGQRLGNLELFFSLFNLKRTTEHFAFYEAEAEDASQNRDHGQEDLALPETRTGVAVADAVPDAVQGQRRESGEAG